MRPAANESPPPTRSTIWMSYLLDRYASVQSLSSSMIADQPVVRRTEIDFDLEGKHVILVDDVLFTGRTVRAAIDALFALGRPARVELLVLVDRGHRELPIEAGYVGERIETERGDRVHVLLQEFDGRDGVEVVRGGAAQ